MRALVRQAADRLRAGGEGAMAEAAALLTQALAEPAAPAGRPSIEAAMREMTELTSGYVELNAWAKELDIEAYWSASGCCWTDEDGGELAAAEPYEALAQYADRAARNSAADGDALRALASRLREPAPEPPSAYVVRPLRQRLIEAAEQQDRGARVAAIDAVLADLVGGMRGATVDDLPADAEAVVELCRQRWYATNIRDYPLQELCRDVARRILALRPEPAADIDPELAARVTGFVEALARIAGRGEGGAVSPTFDRGGLALHVADLRALLAARSPVVAGHDDDALAAAEQRGVDRVLAALETHASAQAQRYNEATRAANEADNARRAAEHMLRTVRGLVASGDGAT